MNFARLNHILIPDDRQGRERLSRSLVGRLVAPMWFVYRASSREGRALTVALLFLGVASMDVATTQAYYAFSALLGLLVGSFVIRRWYALDDVTLTARAPARVAVNEPVSFTIELMSGAMRPHDAVRLRTPFLPWDGRWVLRPAPVPRLAPGETVSREAQAVFVQRGEHHLEPFSAAALVPFGLAVGPTTRSGGCRFLVVPRIAPIATLRLPQVERQQPGGTANASFNGAARELVGVRPYRPGDPIRTLHARTWARTGVPHVRQFRRGYVTRVGVMLDTSRDTLTEAGFEAAISLTAGLVAKLARGEAQLDVLIIGNEIQALVGGSGQGFLDQVLDALARAEPADDVHAGQVLEQLVPLVGNVSSLLMVTPSTDRWSPLADTAAQEGLALRTLRVVDDSWSLARRHNRRPASNEHERLVLVSEIQGNRELRL